VVDLPSFYVHRSYPENGGKKLLRTTTKTETSNTELKVTQILSRFISHLRGYPGLQDFHFLLYAFLQYKHHRFVNGVLSKEVVLTKQH